MKYWGDGAYILKIWNETSKLSRRESGKREDQNSRVDTSGNINKDNSR